MNCVKLTNIMQSTSLDAFFSTDSLINFKKYGTTQNLVIYDYGSIMHYGKHAFAKYAFLKTIEVRKSISNYNAWSVTS